MVDEAGADAVGLLRRAGLGVTAPQRVGAVSTQATHDVLRACADAGIVRRIEPDGSPGLYELRVGDNHHHLICRVCQAIEDVDCSVGSEPCLDPIDDHGYLTDEAEVVCWGVCPACVNASSPASAATHRPPSKE